MIHTNRIVTVGEQESIIDRPIVLYRGDREVEIEFTLVGNEFTFSEEGNVIKSVNASHGQLVLNTPSGEHMFSELAECHEGKVVFVVTKEMIDEFIEMGFYSFQIRLYDSAEMKSRVTIPPVMNGFDIRNPIAAEDEANAVDQAIVDYARIFKDQSNEELPTFTWDGEYVKTEWAHHDVITENKMNKIEDALYSINAHVNESDVVMLNTLDQVKKDADAYVKEHIAEVEADAAEFERNLNTDVQQFKIDTNAAVIGVNKELESVNSQLAHIENQKVLQLLDYKTDSNTWSEAMLDACNVASKYGNGVIKIKNGIYNMSEIDIPVGVRVIGEGEVVIKPENSSSYIFKIKRQSLLENVTLNGNVEGVENVTAIVVDDGSRSVLRDINFISITTGIDIKSNSNCVSIEDADMYLVHKGIICDGSGHRISLKCLSGDAGYTDTQSNGSVGIEFIGSHNTILNGGQIDSCDTGVVCVGWNNTIGNIWIEHCITGITGTEANIGHIYGYNKIDLERAYTSNGLNKSFIIYQLRDNALNTDKMYAHYTFGKIKDGEILDYSGNNHHITIDTSKFSIVDGTYGKCLKTDTTSSGITLLNISDISSGVVNIVCNYNVSDVRHSKPRRIFDISRSGMSVFVNASAGNNIGVACDGTTWYAPTSVFNINDNNRVLSFEIDFTNKKMYLIYTHMKYQIPIPEDKVDTLFETLSTGTVTIARSWMNDCSEMCLNYVYIFEKEMCQTDIINFNNMMSHTYNQNLIQSIIEKHIIN